MGGGYERSAKTLNTSPGYRPSGPRGHPLRYLEHYMVILGFLSVYFGDIELQFHIRLLGI